MATLSTFPDRRDYNAALKSIATLRASGIDGITPFEYLMRLYHGLPRSADMDAEEKTLISCGLLSPDGSVSMPVRLALHTWFPTSGF